MGIKGTFLVLVVFFLSSCGFFKAMFESVPSGVGVVYGVVRKAENPTQTVAGVTITCGGETTTSEGNGFYMFKDLPVGTYQLKAKIKGRLNYLAYLTVSSKTIEHNITMEKGTYLSYPGDKLPPGKVYWRIEESPYLILNNLTLTEETKLEIEPGVEIRFAENKNFNLVGKVVLKGKSFSYPPKFTSITPDKYWGGIVISKIGTIVSQCIIEQAYNGITLTKDSYGVLIEENIIINCAENGIMAHPPTTLKIKKNQIKNNGFYGLWAKRASLEMEHNVIEGNRGNGIELLECDLIKITENTISKNGKYGLSLEATRVKRENLLIEKNNFLENADLAVFNLKPQKQKEIVVKYSYFYNNLGKGRAVEGQEETYQWSKGIRISFLLPQPWLFDGPKLRYW
jgi:parallel beta-helix repeat protein